MTAVVIAPVKLKSRAVLRQIDPHFHEDCYVTAGEPHGAVLR